MLNKTRYMIVEHSVEDEQLKIVSGQVVGTQPVHHLVAAYHWVRLDSEHILLKADYHIKNHNELVSHPKVSLLPAFGSSKPLVTHIVKDKHLKAVHAVFNLTDFHTVEDLVDKVVGRHGHLYSL